MFRQWHAPAYYLEVKIKAEKSLITQDSKLAQNTEWFQDIQAAVMISAANTKSKRVRMKI